jgi:hypothetical protein
VASFSVRRSAGARALFHTAVCAMVTMEAQPRREAATSREETEARRAACKTRLQVMQPERSTHATSGTTVKVYRTCRLILLQRWVQ